MSGDIINLNKARKAKAKRESQSGAKSNRMKFGRGKAEIMAEKRDAERATRTLEQHRLERAPGEPD